MSEKSERFVEWSVYVKNKWHYKWVDSVFFKESCTRDYIMQQLVRWDCYPANITIIRRYDLER